MVYFGGIENVNKGIIRSSNGNIECLQSTSQQRPTCLQRKIEKCVNDNESLGNSASNEIAQDYGALED